MNIAATQFSLGQNALEIYVSGCDGACPGCHNRELQDYTLGRDSRSWYDRIIRSILDFPELVQNIWILGGEPLLQNPDDLIDLLQFLQFSKIPIYLFTRFEADQVPDKILDLVDYVKTGSYREHEQTQGLIQYGIQLASANQRIWTAEEIKTHKKEKQA